MSEFVTASWVWVVLTYKGGAWITAIISYVETPEGIVGKTRLFRAIARGLAWPWLVFRYFRPPKE